MPELAELLGNLIAAAMTGKARGASKLAASLHVLIRLEPEWTEDQLLPLFREEVCLASIWEGYLLFGRCTEAVSVALLGSITRILEHQHRISETASRHLPRKLLESAFLLPAGSEDNSILLVYLRKADPEGRELLWQTLQSMLRRYRKDAGEEAEGRIVDHWQRWLGPLVEQRIRSGIDYSSGEWPAISALGAHVDVLVEEILPLAESRPAPRTSSRDLRLLLRSAPWTSNADVRCKYLLFLIGGMDHLGYNVAEVRNLIQGLDPDLVPEVLIEKLKERYVQLGGLTKHFDSRA